VLKVRFADPKRSVQWKGFRFPELKPPAEPKKDEAKEA
jgi:hypothetical protein